MRPYNDGFDVFFFQHVEDFDDEIADGASLLDSFGLFLRWLSGKIDTGLIKFEFLWLFGIIIVGQYSFGSRIGLVIFVNFHEGLEGLEWWHFRF